MNQRLFAALELPAALTETLAALSARLREQMPPRRVRWVEPRNIHLTLKFYGEVKAEAVTSLQESLTRATAGHAPLTLALGGLGLFPNAVRPRVVWVGLTGDVEGLRALQTAIEQGAVPLGFPPEARAFAPHLTLGRVTDGLRPTDRPRVAHILQTTNIEPLSFTAPHLSLMRSELRPAGPLYTRLFSAPLNG